MKHQKETAFGQEDRPAPDQDHRCLRGPGRRARAEEQIVDRKQKQRESQGIEPEGDPARSGHSRPDECLSRHQHKVTDNKSKISGLGHYSCAGSWGPGERLPTGQPRAGKAQPLRSHRRQAWASRRQD